MTQDELTIKGHFDQIMVRASPSYIEDTYIRGPWLRRLARFALFGFTEYGCYERYDAFVEDWENYFATVCGTRVDTSDRSDSEGEDEAEDDESDEDGEEAEGDLEIEDALPTQ